MRPIRSLLLSMALLAAPTLASSAVAPPANVTSAAASASRSPDNVKMDAGRNPVQLLRFLGLRQGAQVLDMFGANKYWAEIVAPAIGPAGHVTVWQPTQFMTDERRKDFDVYTAKQTNVSLISSPFETPDLPRSAFDFSLINLDYHDVYWQSEERKISRIEPSAWLKRLYAAMKPGAIVGVVDHAARPGGDTRAVVDKLHRIDPAVVRRDFRNAGFVLVGSSAMYRNPADDHSLLVFDDKIRGKTDRFVLKFRKPR